MFAFYCEASHKIDKVTAGMHREPNGSPFPSLSPMSSLSSSSLLSLPELVSLSSTLVTLNVMDEKKKRLGKDREDDGDDEKKVLKRRKLEEKDGGYLEVKVWGDIWNHAAPFGSEKSVSRLTCSCRQSRSISRKLENQYSNEQFLAGS